MCEIEVIKGDITQLHVDAIVNAANTQLLGGGGVDGAIHRAAGHELLEECKKLGGCATGDAKITKGYKLAAKYVIHAVGPVWRGGQYGEAELLKNAYLRSLQIAHQYGIKTIAFPNISTGVYGYPKQEAADIAIKAVKRFLDNHPDAFSKIIFVCFDDTNYKIYQSKLNIQ